ncbi:14594_t:CDS:2 [Funneliformis geosporum]|uniref:2258_t:CDS:1 n=1 Tax=Funneliformis geosporum TaxID=1117311 RepID=A0A9W4STN4_9GLOM|nr:14594_t:CDS:2 [Funneliformis geosporum]CAI2181059.1 2258_t:CDS:2 [Funneliformis geosporum]
MEHEREKSSKKLTKYTITTPIWHYLKIKINFDPQTIPLPPISPLSLRTLFNHALTDSFGIIGSGIHIDILDWNGEIDNSNYVGIIRVPKENMTTLWSALTLFSATLDISTGISISTVDANLEENNINLKGISFQVLGNSPYLMGLINDSREWSKKLMA